MGEAGLGRALVAVCCVFVANGIVIGAWAVRAAEVQREHGLSETGLGAALVCASLGNCYPVALAAAGFSDGRGSVAASVALVAAVGYTGFLMGPALIGLLTAAVSLSGALCALVVAMVAVLLLARRVAVADVET